MTRNRRSTVDHGRKKMTDEMMHEEIEIYNGKYNYHFDRSTEPAPIPAAMTADALMSELDDLVQVLTLKNNSEYMAILNNSEPGRRYNAIRSELARRLNHIEANDQPAKVEYCYSFVCMNSMLSNRLFIESAFNGDEDAIKTAADYKATLYKIKLVDGEQTEKEMLYSPGE